MCVFLYLLRFSCAVAQRIAKVPFTPGHEVVGEVSAVHSELSVPQIVFKTAV